MARLLDKPIHTKSKGGWNVTIDSIDPSNHDCVLGKITTPGTGKQDGKWNRSGIMRDGIDGGNLLMNDGDLHDLGELLDKLRVE